MPDAGRPRSRRSRMRIARARLLYSSTPAYAAAIQLSKAAHTSTSRKSESSQRCGQMLHPSQLALLDTSPARRPLCLRNSPGVALRNSSRKLRRCSTASAVTRRVVEFSARRRTTRWLHYSRGSPLTGGETRLSGAFGQERASSATRNSFKTTTSRRRRKRAPPRSDEGAENILGTRKLHVVYRPPHAR